MYLLIDNRGSWTFPILVTFLFITSSIQWITWILTCITSCDLVKSYPLKDFGIFWKVAWYRFKSLNASLKTSLCPKLRCSHSSLTDGWMASVQPYHGVLNWLYLFIRLLKELVNWPFPDPTKQHCFVTVRTCWVCLQLGQGQERRVGTYTHWRCKGHAIHKKVYP